MKHIQLTGNIVMTWLKIFITSLNTFMTLFYWRCTSHGLQGHVKSHTKKTLRHVKCNYSYNDS